FADARPGKDGFGKHRATEQRADLQADHRKHRDQRVAQAVHEHHPCRRQALGPCGADVVLAQHFEHRGAGHACDHRQRDGAEHDGRQDQVHQRVLERAFLVAEQGVDEHEAGGRLDVVEQVDAPGHRRPAQPDREEHDQDQAPPEDRHRAEPFHGLGVHLGVDPAFAHHHLHRVTGDQAYEREREQGDAEERRDQQAQTPCNKTKHRVVYLISLRHACERPGADAASVIVLLHPRGGEVVVGHRVDDVALDVLAQGGEHLR
uniref:ATP synthase beta subunit n=1 Tax=Steinernema glaseri TaxID=37863 RepID=A0A1I8AW89_9BILA